MFQPVRVPPDDVHDVLKRHILVDGYPLVVDLERSHGSWVRDARSDKEYLDFFSFFASNPIGFNHPRIRDEEVRGRLVTAATTRVANADKYTSYMAEFVETLARTAAPPSHPHYFFIDGGALAVENALKTAFDWKVRKNLARGAGQKGSKVIHLERAFHGRSGYTLSLTNTDPNKTDYFPKFDWPRIPAPAIDFTVQGKPEDDIAEREARSLNAAADAFAAHPGDVAAIIVEPIQGEGGDNHFRPEFLRGLRALADSQEALLIYDEVQTGLGLTGRWWAYQHHGVEPDIICFAKKMQVGGIFVSRRVDDVPDNVFRKSGRINSTWGGSLVDMVRCTRILEIIVDDDLLANAAARGTALLAGLRQLEAECPAVSNARGAGLMCAMDLPDPAARDAVIKACFAEGMIVLGCGRRSLRFRPALTLEADLVEEGLRRLGQAVRKVTA